jgi:hypothetical protein
VNEVSTTEEPVSSYAEDIIKHLLSFEHPAGAFDDVQPLPHRLSPEAIALRIVAMKGQPYAAVRGRVVEILSEVELYRLGFDEGLERGHSDGYDQAVHDMIHNPDAISAALLALRDKEADR